MQKYKSELNNTKTFYDANGTNRKKRKTNNSLLSKTIIIICVLILHIILVYIAMYKNNKEIEQLRVEIDDLKRDMEFMYQFLDNDYFHEINKAIENEDYNDDADKKTDFNSKLNGTIEYSGRDAEINSKTNDYAILNKGQGHQASLNAKSNRISRNKREMLSATIDGVPIIAESYLQRKQNGTASRNNNGVADTFQLYASLDKATTITASLKQQRYNDSTTPIRNSHGRWLYGVRHGRHQKQTPMISRISRVMNTNNEDTSNKRIRKTLVRRSQQQFQEQIQSPEMTLTQNVQGHRRKKHGSARLETMDERHPRTARFISAIHFTGNMERYERNHHEHYEGNGRLRHPEGLYIDWHPSSWVKTLGMDRLYLMHNGTLTIKETGLYFIYAQIYYLDKHDKNGYRIYKNDKYLAQCTITAHSERNLTKANTCYTSVVEYLQEGDQMMIKDIEKLRYVFFDHASSFFGLVKLTYPKAMK